MKHALKLTLAAGLAFFCITGNASSAYPSKPIRIVVPFSPGGLSDNMARIVADELSKKFNVRVMVENKTGGNTIPAALEVIRAEPDGYTIGWFAGNTFVTTPFMTTNVPYSVNDFSPIIMVYRGPMVLVASNKIPPTNITEYVEYIKGTGAPALIGSTSVGGTGYLQGTNFGMEAGFKVEPVSYKGGPELVVALREGSLSAANDIVDTFISHHNDKNLKIIGVASEEPIAALPGVQTFAQAGYPNATTYFWQGIVAPEGTPPEIVNTLYDAIKEATTVEAFKRRLSPDLEVMALNPADFSRYIQAEKAKWEPVMERLGLKAASK